MWKCFTISAFTILKNMDRKEKIPSAKPIRNAFLLVTCRTSEGKLRGEALVGVRVLNSYDYRYLEISVLYSSTPMNFRYSLKTL